MVIKKVCDIERQKRNKSFDDTLRPILVSEGDSWFNYPDSFPLSLMEKFHGVDIIDALIDSHGWRGHIYSLDCPGETLSDMLNDRTQDNFEEVMRRLKPDAYLLSAGGNDYIHRFIKTDRRPSQKLIDAFVIELEAMMKQMFTTVREASAKSHIFIHGYDYAPVVSRYFVDSANEMIQGLAPHFCDDKGGLFTSLDLRHCLSSQHWLEDGIHPNPAGFQILANEFHLSLTAKGLYPQIKQP